MTVLPFEPGQAYGPPDALHGLPITALARMMREAERILVRDKTYRQTPIGMECARFLRALRWADGAENTQESYETVLARFAIDHADFEGLVRFCEPGGTEYIEEFLYRHWGEASAATKSHRLRVLRSLFKWAVGDGRVPFNPALAIKTPRGKTRERAAYQRDLLMRLIAPQSLRDQVALQLLGRMALRKDELRRVQIRDIDLARNLLTVHGKGGKVAVLPFGALTSLRDDLYLHIQGDERQPDEYLLYPHRATGRPMNLSTVHRWFKRCLERAGLPTMIEMHELRHSAADELWRTTGNIVLAQQLLRHESVGTTQAYLHPSREDLTAGLALVEQLWQAER